MTNMKCLKLTLNLNLTNPKGYSLLSKVSRKKKATVSKSLGKLISTLTRVWLLPLKAMNRFFTTLLTHVRFVF